MRADQEPEARDTFFRAKFKNKFGNWAVVKLVAFKVLSGLVVLTVTLVVLWPLYFVPSPPLSRPNDNHQHGQQIKVSQGSSESEDLSNPKSATLSIADFGNPESGPTLPAVSGEASAVPETPKYAEPSAQAVLDYAELDQKRPRELIGRQDSPFAQRMSASFSSLCRLFRQLEGSQFSNARIEGLRIHPKVQWLHEDCPSPPKTETEWQNVSGLFEELASFGVGREKFLLTLTADDYQNALRFNALINSDEAFDRDARISEILLRTEDIDLLLALGASYISKPGRSLEKWLVIYSQAEEQAVDTAMKIYLQRMSEWSMYMLHCERFPDRCNASSWFAVRRCLSDHVCYEISDFSQYRELTLSSAERALTDLIVEEIKSAAGVAGPLK